MTDSARIFGPRSPHNPRMSRRRGVQVIAHSGQVLLPWRDVRRLMTPLMQQTTRPTVLVKT